MSTPEDTSTGDIPFTVGDQDSPASALTVTATTSNPTLVPGGNIVLGGTGAYRTMRVTPAANQSGAVVVTVSVSDGQLTSTATLALTVTAANDAPVAADDSYSLSAGQSLTVSAATGVLANDSDIDSPALSLTATVVNQPAHGTLAPSSDGSFTYTPSATFAGNDRFTYRASDGAATSAPATVTLTVAPTQCAPRPKVVTSPAAGGGKLQVHVESTPSGTQRNNVLQGVTVTRLDNARVTIAGQPMAEGQSFTLPANAVATDLTIERVATGQATTVQITVVDSCGEWKTFVGGGAGAGF
jgi:hypothetical protein